MGEGLAPEEKIAKRLLSSHGLTIPFSLDSLRSCVMKWPTSGSER